MSREIDLEDLSAEDEKYLRDRENIIGVPNLHSFSKGSAPWGDTAPPVNTGDVNAAQMSHSTDLNTVGDEAHPILEEGGALPVVERVPMTDASNPQATTALEAEAARHSIAGGGASDYRSMTVAELREQLEGRTDEDGDPLPKSGTKFELILRLEENDQKGSAQETAQSLAAKEQAEKEAAEAEQGDGEGGE